MRVWRRQHGRWGGRKTLADGTGQDAILGGDYPDTLRGGEGSDLIDGGTGADLMCGAAGNDSINGTEGGPDTLHGALGPGEDITHVPAGTIWLVDAGAQTRVLGHIMPGTGTDDGRVVFAIRTYDDPAVSSAN